LLAPLVALNPTSSGGRRVRDGIPYRNRDANRATVRQRVKTTDLPSCKQLQYLELIATSLVD